MFIYVNLNEVKKVQNYKVNYSMYKATCYTECILFENVIAIKV